MVCVYQGPSLQSIRHDPARSKEKRCVSACKIYVSALCTPPRVMCAPKLTLLVENNISHTYKDIELRDGKRCFSSRPVTRKCTTRGLAKTEEWKIHVHSEDLGGEHSRKRTLASWNVTASTSSWRSPWYPAASSRQHAESDKVHMCRGSTRCLRNVSAHLKLTRR